MAHAGGDRGILRFDVELLPRGARGFVGALPADAALGKELRVIDAADCGGIDNLSIGAGNLALANGLNTLCRDPIRP